MNEELRTTVPKGFLTWPRAVHLWLAHKRPGETMTMALFDEGGQWLIKGLRDGNLNAYVADNADARLEPDWSQWLGRPWDAMTPLERLRDPKERVLRGDWASVAGKKGLFCFKETELVRRLMNGGDVCQLGGGEMNDTEMYPEGQEEIDRRAAMRAAYDVFGDLVLEDEPCVGDMKRKVLLAIKAANDVLKERHAAIEAATGKSFYPIPGIAQALTATALDARLTATAFEATPTFSLVGNWFAAFGQTSAALFSLSNAEMLLDNDDCSWGDEHVETAITMSFDVDKARR